MTLATATTGDDLTIKADHVTATSLKATYTGGADDNGDGSNIRVTTNGDQRISSSNAVYGIALTTTGP